MEEKTIKNELIIILLYECVVLVVQLTKAHVERQLQVNHPPALHVLTKQKSIAPVSRGHGFKPH